jgi:sodium-dependent dicarboxylate transporter 2/3/5
LNFKKINTTHLITALPPLLLIIELMTGCFSSLSALTPTMTLTIISAFWMVSWWILEVTPLGVTALIPLIIFPFLDIMSIKKIAPNFSNSIIYLFLGGFMLARSLEKTQLSERFALFILQKTAYSSQGVLIGFVIATSFLSMWISNTATTVMMIPIALSVLAFLKDNHQDINNFTIKLFLSIAYSANIGGIMTPVGTPPNVVLMGYLNDIYHMQIDFSRWMLITIPIALATLVFMLFLLNIIFPAKINFNQDFRSYINLKMTTLGPLNKKQKVTLAIFLTVCFLWVFKNLIHYLIGFSFLNDTSVAIFGGVSLFLFQILDDQDIPKLPWNIILLFGGGMALAATLSHVGVIEMATTSLAGLNFSSPWLLILVTSGCILFLTEIMSNVALCVVALPLLMKLAEAQGLPPLLMAIPATICASFAFSMPVSTPPNAIVFATGKVKIIHMLKAGILLNLVSLMIVMSVGWFLLTNLGVTP